MKIKKTGKCLMQDGNIANVHSIAHGSAIGYTADGRLGA